MFFPLWPIFFFASGVTNFGKLALLTENVIDVSDYDSSVSLENKITILGFLGNDIANRKGNAFNLNQKIYKRFYQFKDFQFVMVLPKGTEEGVTELKKELGMLADVKKWKFVFAEKEQIKNQFNSLKTNLSLDKNLATPYVFVIDKNLNLRGRTDDEGRKIWL